MGLLEDVYIVDRKKRSVLVLILVLMCLKSYKGNYYNNDLVNALVSLEYKKSDIYKIIDKIDSSKKIDEQIKDAILLLG